MKRKFFFNDFENEDEDNFTWPERKRTKKREEKSDKYTNGFFSTNEVKCVGNRIYFNCSVRNSTVGRLVRIIERKNYEFKMIISHELIGKAEPAPIYLHINSGGGDLMAAMSAVDAIKRSYVPIYTVVDGRAASAASLMSVVGHKRYMTKHSYMLIHQLSSGVVGKYQDIEDEYTNCNLMMDDIIEIYKNNSELTEKKIKKFLKRDKWWKSNMCLDYGLVDEVMDGIEEPKQFDLIKLLQAAAGNEE
jgi:ATP-dependent Clp protease, protease subunit